MLYQNADDKFYDFAMTEYEAISESYNKLKSINILFNSIDDMEYYDLMEKLTSELIKLNGDNKFVWSIKNTNNNIHWELYFYLLGAKPLRLDNSSTIYDINRIKFDNRYDKISDGVLNKFFNMPKLDISINTMLKSGTCWSFDIGNKKNFKEIDNINLYTITKNLYECNNNGINLLNIYDWFSKSDFKKSNDFKANLFDRINLSVFTNEHTNIDDILIPEFMEYYNKLDVDYDKDWLIFFANKRKYDSIYYMKLNIDMLIIMLKRFNYPDKQIDFLESNKSNFDHLLFDFGFNYKMEKNKLKITHTSYYGTI